MREGLEGNEGSSPLPLLSWSHQKNLNLSRQKYNRHQRVKVKTLVERALHSRVTYSWIYEHSFAIDLLADSKPREVSLQLWKVSIHYSPWRTAAWISYCTMRCLVEFLAWCSIDGTYHFLLPSSKFWSCLSVAKFWHHNTIYRRIA